MPNMTTQPLAMTDSAPAPATDTAAAYATSDESSQPVVAVDTAPTPAPANPSRESDARTATRTARAENALDEKVKRSVARLLDDGAYEDAWEILATNDGVATAEVLGELRQRVRRACTADNADLRSRGQPTIVCP